MSTSSILTNMSAMSAVQNLTATEKALATTQNQIATGLSVSSAQDNAAYWSIATNMRTQNNDLTTVSSSLNLGASVLGTATAALNSMLTVLQTIQADVVSAQTSGTGSTDIQTEITQLQSQLTNSVSAASFNGVNLLDGSSTAGASFVSSVTGSGVSVQTQFLTVEGYDFSSAGNTAGLDGAGTMSVAGATAGALAAMLTQVGTAINNVKTASEVIGSTASNIMTQSTFVSALADSITTGIGSLVDADMNEASTRLNALQTQQQLGVQSLSVANQNSQIILKLFGGG